MTRKIGVVGGGQLGRMLGLAGVPLGFEFRFWDPSAKAPARAVGELFQANYDDLDAAERFAAGLDVITYEFENIPAATMERLQALVECRPGVLALATSQDRLTEKTFFQNNGIETAPWRAISTVEEMRAAVAEFGSCIVKTRRFGYDGKGQARINSVEQCDTVFDELGKFDLIVEKTVSFTRELSLVGVRGADGDLATWPLVENEHRVGILHKTVAPAPGVSTELQQCAESIMRSTMEGLGHVGVLTIEFFEVEGRLLANEMAPRVHNSGHWTIEGAVTSQFENHIRAVCGLPLGSCAPRFDSVMLNSIGAVPSAAAVCSIPGAHYHDYGKTSRPGRKVGHVTVCDEPVSIEPAGNFDDRVAAVERLVEAATATAADV
jgi:5-(carboxyamino)imidazole ribonucleotide synthase